MKYGAWAITRLAASTVTFLLAVSPCGAAGDNLQQSFAVETAAAQMRIHHDIASSR